MPIVKPASAIQYRQTIVDMVRAERARVVVEVGVYSGILSMMLAEIEHVKSLTIIDTWAEWPGKFDQAHMDALALDVIAWAATAKLKGGSAVKVIRQESIPAAATFDDDSINFWETDGDHAYEAVKAETAAGLPKVKPGGLMAGDNYEAPTVKRAVDESFESNNVVSLEANGRVWWIRKPVW